MAKRYYACIYLNDHALACAVAKKCSGIVFYHKSVSYCPPEIELLNVNAWDREAYLWMFETNKNKLQEWSKLSPSFFLYKGISLVNAVNKDLFWAGRLDGMVTFTCLHKLPEDAEITWDSSLRSAKGKMKSVARIAFTKARSVFRHKSKVTSVAKYAEFAFCIADHFELEYFNPILTRLKNQSCLLLSNYLHPSKVKLKKSEVKNLVAEGYDVSSRSFPIGAIRKGKKFFALREIVKVIAIRNDLMASMDANESNMQAPGLKAIFLIAQENTGYGIVTALQAKQKKIRTVNSHNGTKSGDVYNRDNVFDSWCVWDEQMKRLLHEACLIPNEQLVVTGAMKQDIAVSWKYTGSFDEWTKNNRRDKKIISFFSVHADFSYRKTVPLALIDVVRERKDSCLLIRLHPMEKLTDWDWLISMDDPSVQIIHPSGDAGRNRLYDQLSISTVTVTLGSTVTVESKWFGVPSITYEERETSIVYAVDGRCITHVAATETLKKKVHEILDGTPGLCINNNHDYQPAADRILSCAGNSVLSL